MVALDETRASISYESIDYMLSELTEDQRVKVGSIIDQWKTAADTIETDRLVNVFPSPYVY